MARTILMILGVILALWVLMGVIGWIMSMVKLFFFVGLAAVVVFLVVTLVSKAAKSG
ncbi:MAG: hypothetical protein IRY90_02470 [Actinomadura rubrobrunea]|nr:hypothetical protein [Actinomadura rubrobrunea]